MRSDIEISYATCWFDDDKGGLVEKIDGFKFYTKAPFSKSYQYHSTIGLEYTYDILSLIQKGIKGKDKAVLIEVTGGWGLEKVYIWRGSYKKAEKLMIEMISKIQQQY